MMKLRIRRVHPLSWLVLLWLAVAWFQTLNSITSYSRYSSTQHSIETVSTMLVGSMLVVIHLGVYEIAFRLKLSRCIQWLLLFAQALFVLLLTQLTQNELVAFTFSLVLLVASMEILKPLRLMLVANGCFLGLMFLYMNNWFYFWRGNDTIFVLPELLIATGLVFYLQQQRAHEQTQMLLYDLHTTHEQLSAYALRVEELTMLTERQRLARELHDTLTQGVAGLLMQLEATSSYLSKGQPDRANEIVQSTMAQVRIVLIETRYVLQDLRADHPRPDDLPEMVQEEIDCFTNNTNIPCMAELAALTVTPEAHSGHVLRVICEGLTNIARHAQAHCVWICTSTHEDLLAVEVRDDGIGFDPIAATTRPGHYGLVGLRERVRLIGGHIDILSSPGQGTCIRIGVPLCNEGHSNG